MGNKKRGLKIGKYRITPLGIGTILGILVIAAVLILYPRLSSDRNTTEVVTRATEPPQVDFEPDSTPDGAEATAVATPVPTAAPTEEPRPKEATIRLLADITMEMNLLRSAANVETQSFDFSSMFSLINDSIGNADYTIANVNGTLGGTTTTPSGTGKMITPPSLIDTLKEAGVDMLMAGGRYSLDGGLDEMQGTLTNLEIAGIDALGINATEESKGQPVLVEIGGIQVAVFGYTETLNTSSSNGDVLDHVNLISRSSDAAARIQAARDAGAEFVIAVVDWGTTDSMNLTASQQKIAEVLTNANVDVIFGCGPSALQPMAYLSNSSGDHQTLCIAAAGNLLSDQTKAGFNCGMIVEIDIAEQDDGVIKISNVSCVPTYVLRYQDASQNYQYRALAIGQWLNNGGEDLLDGMSNADLQRMEQYWNRFNNQYGSIAEIARQ